MNRGRRLAWLQIGVLVVTSLAVYSRNLDDYFLSDDFDLIQSVYGKGLGYAASLLVNDEASDIWDFLCYLPDSQCPDPENHGFLRPLKIWLLMAEVALFGDNATGYHLSGTLLFVMNVVLVFLILRRLVAEDSGGIAFLGGFVTAIHPVFSECVPSITFREEVLATACMLAALWYFIRARLDGRSPVGFYVFSALAMLSKESAIVAIGLAAVFDASRWLVGDRTVADLKRRAVTFVPLIPILAVYFSLRYVAFGNFTGGHGESNFLSIDQFTEFHGTFFGFLFREPMFSLSQYAWMPAIVVVAVVASFGYLYRQRRQLTRDDLANLLFLGPGFYAATTAISYAVYFAPRHVVAPVIGMTMFSVYVFYAILRVSRTSHRTTMVLCAAAIAAIAFLPPTLTMSGRYDRASRTVREVRSEIEERTRNLPDGSRVLLVGVPLGVGVPQYLTDFSLRSALKRPFTESDIGNRPITFEFAVPGGAPPGGPYDLVLRFETEAPGVVRQR